MGNSSQEWLWPVGWRVVSTLWVMDGPAQAGVYWPFATVLIKGNQMAFLIRGTETYDDWLTGKSCCKGRSSSCVYTDMSPYDNAVLHLQAKSTHPVQSCRCFSPDVAAS
jgi:hypothetical protein